MGVFDLPTEAPTQSPAGGGIFDAPTNVPLSGKSTSVFDAVNSLPGRQATYKDVTGLDLTKTQSSGLTPQETTQKYGDITKETISQAPKEGFWSKVGDFFGSIGDLINGETSTSRNQRQNARTQVIQSTTDTLNNQPYIEIAKQLGIDKAITPNIPKGVDQTKITPNVLQHYREQTAANVVKNNLGILQKQFPDLKIPDKIQAGDVEKQFGTDPNSLLGKTETIAGILGTAGLAIGTEGLSGIVQSMAEGGWAEAGPKIVSLAKNIGLFTALDKVTTPLRNELVKNGNIGDGGQALLFVAQQALNILGTHGAGKGVDKIIDLFAKHTIEGYQLPQTFTLSGADLQKITRTDKMSSGQIDQMANDLGWSDEQKNALKNGATVTTPSYKIITTVDKPWWGKVKGLFGFEPTNDTSVEKTGGSMNSGALTGEVKLTSEDLQKLVQEIKGGGTPSASPNLFPLPKDVQDIASQFKQKAPEPVFGEKNVKQEIIPIARHGDNLLDEKGISAGHEQPGLTENGKKQIEEGAAKDWKGKGIQNVISSDATRAKQSAIITGKAIGAKVVTDPRLRTQDIGNLANKPEDTVKPIVKDMINNHPDEKVGGTGESFNEFRARFEEGYKAQLAKHPNEKNAFMLHGDGEKLVRSDFGRNMTEYNNDGIEHGKTTEVPNPLKETSKTPAESRKTLPERPTELKRVTEYKDRLKLHGADPVLVDTILTPRLTEAWGAAYEGTLTFTKIVEAFTEDHEIFHQVFQNMEKMRLFKGFDKGALLDEAKALYGDLKPEQLEEELAKDFQQYVNERESGKQTSFFGKIVEFFQKLFASLKRIFKNKNDIKEFYRTMVEGRAIEETTIKDTSSSSFKKEREAGMVIFSENIPFNEENLSKLRDQLATAQGHLDMAVANQELFGDKIPGLKTKVDNLRAQIKEAKFPTAEKTDFSSGDKIQDVKDALDAVEKRVGVKATNISQFTQEINREQLTLAAAQETPQAHLKALGRDVVPEQKEKIEDLKTKIIDALEPPKIRVSNKDIQISEDLYLRQLNLAMKEEDLNNSPYKQLEKYVAQSGNQEGHLPEVTGQKPEQIKKTKEYGRLKNPDVINFIQHGDEIIQKVFGAGEDYASAPDTEDIRAGMDKYLDDQKKLSQDKKTLRKETADYIASARDEVALSKFANASATKVEIEYDKIKAEQEGKKNLERVQQEKEARALAEKGKKYGFTVPEYNPDAPLSDVPDIIAQEHLLKLHPANPFLKYVNPRTGKLPLIDKEFPGEYGKLMTALLQKKGYSSVDDAQKAIDNYYAHVQVLTDMTNERFDPLELDSAPISNAFAAEKARLENDPNAVPLSTMVQSPDEKSPVLSQVGLHDFLRTPYHVLDKIGLHDEGQQIIKAYNGYLKELPKNIDKISEWAKRVPGKDSSKRIFGFLNGSLVDDEGFVIDASSKVTDKDKYIFLTPEETKVAYEIRNWLDKWAERLHLPVHERIYNYITHIFEADLIKREFDQDFANIIRDKVPGSVYNPFLEHRLGQMGYVQDTWRALDAYAKRATRKVYMDPALEQLKLSATAKNIDDDTMEYIRRYTGAINLRPTRTDLWIDKSIKQMLSLTGNPYALGARPFATITRTGRKLVYRGMLGFSVSSAIKRMTQATNTYAMLGEKYTALGYAKLGDASNRQEMKDEGIFLNNLIQDRSISSTKKFWQNVDKGLFIMYQTVENINRGATYLGAKAKYLAENTRVLNGTRVWKDGTSEVTARAYAKKMVGDTQFTFSAVDTPVALQSDLAKTVLQFQSFNTKQAEYLAGLIKTKNYAGMIRWLGASLLLVYAVGKIMNYTWKDLIPFYSTISGTNMTPPLIAGPIKIGAAIAGSPDKYGNVPTGSQRILNAGNAVVPFLPAGLQIQKTVKGILAMNQGYVGSTTSGIPQYLIPSGWGAATQALIFGPTANPAAQAYYQSIGAPSKAKATYDEIQQLIKDGKQSTADAIWNAMTPKEQGTYKAEVTRQWEIKMLPTAMKVWNLMKDGKKDEAAKITGAMTQDEYKYYVGATKMLQNAQTGTASNNNNGIATFEGHATYYGGSKGPDASKILGGNSDDGQVSGYNPNAEPIYKRDASLESSRRKELIAQDPYWSVTASQFDHIIPLEAGGTNTENNVMLISKVADEGNQQFEDYLGGLYKAGQISRADAAKASIDYKINKTVSLTDVMNGKY